jgi:plasmid stability protein
MAKTTATSAITVRGLDAGAHRALKQRAARAGRSLESEIRRILAAALASDDSKPGTQARRLFLENFGAPLDFAAWPKVPGDGAPGNPFARARSKK